MAIPDYARTNYSTLLRAAGVGDLALMECLDASTREPRYVLCAVGRDGSDYVFTPFGHLAPGNPFEAYLPPADDGGFVTPGLTASAKLTAITNPDEPGHAPGFVVSGVSVMGWLYMQSLGGHSGPRQYLDAQFTYEKNERCVRVLRSSLVKVRTYYAAVEVVPADGPREVTAVVCLVRYNPRDAEGYVFGYKDTDETMGPCEAACPAAILDLLTPTTSEYANAWRARCRAALAERAAVPKLRDGDLVVFTEPIRFTDGTEHRRMKVVVNPHRPRAVRFRPPGGGGLYRIGGMERLAFSVVRVS